jgi:hypothetical protein
MLLAHYGIKSAAVHTNTDALARDLDHGRKVIVGLNDRTIWNKPGDRGFHRNIRAGMEGQRQLCRRDRVTLRPSPGGR